MQLSISTLKVLEPTKKRLDLRDLTVFYTLLLLLLLAKRRHCCRHHSERFLCKRHIVQYL
ncbi:hypothetical protein DQM17_09220 [Lacticaseibacillus paracasei]|nr:hypothetical protein DQM17_09220 [Lacticaseibacillus paracasei]